MGDRKVMSGWVVKKVFIASIHVLGFYVGFKDVKNTLKELKIP